MKKDGFTLVELLAVIVILGVLALIVTISTNDTIDNSKTKLSQIQIQKVEQAAKMYYLNEGVNESLYNSNEAKTCVNVSYLTENDYLEESEIKDPKDNSEILGSVKITYKNKKYKYEYQDTECMHSDYFVSVDAVCDLVSDADSSDSVTPGDKYQCKVKEKMETGFEDGYYFYVLSYNDKDGNITEDIEEAKTINLIMDRNINSDGTPVTKAIPKSSPENGIYNIVAWADREDSITFIPYDPVFCLSEKCATNTDGPITAINYLYNATKDWINIPNIDINYIDEGSNYGSIKTINGLTQITKKDGTVVTVLTDQEGYPNLKVRTPYYSEVSDLNETNEYLYEFLGGMTGYWLFSSYSDDSIGALLVSSEGSLSINIAETTNINGLRPVITLGL